MAAKSLNKVLLIGNVTRDPELRYTPQGSAVATFGVATNRSWKTDSGEIREEAEFHKLVAWNKLAELCAQLCTKGRKIYIEGRIQNRSYTGQDNVQHYITEIVIEDMILLDYKPGLTAYAAKPGLTAYAAKNVAGGGVASSPTTAAAAADNTAKPKKGKKEENKEEEKPAVAKSSGEVTEEVNAEDIPF